MWRKSDVKRWMAYDDDLSGLETFCREHLQREEDEDEVWELTEDGRAKRLKSIRLDEKQASVACKTLIAACRGKLRDLTVEPRWILDTPVLVSSDDRSTREM